MYATAVPNSGALPHNRDAFNLRVFDGDAEVGNGAIVYFRTLRDDIPVIVQLMERLAEKGFKADLDDARSLGAGYRFENVRRA